VPSLASAVDGVRSGARTPPRAQADAIPEVPAAAPLERDILHDVGRPSSFTACTPPDSTPVARAAERAPTTVAQAAQRANPPQIAGEGVSSRQAPDGSSAASPRIHIGAVEVRSAAPAPAPPAVRTARRADAMPISRGYAWRFGLVQG
jgi:hypothetical protein